MDTLKIESHKQYLEVSLNLPEKRNAFGVKMIKELTKIFSQEMNKDHRFLFLKGEGPSFCAGADLEWMKSMADFSFEENLSDSQELLGLFQGMQSCEIPILTKVHGHVMGGANGLVALSDVVIADENTQFAFSEVQIGLIPAVISPFILLKMNAASAREKMLTGRRFSAAEALQGGLIEYCSPTAEMDTRIERVKTQLLSAGPQALRDTKLLLKKVCSGISQDEINKFTTEMISNKRVSDEGQEGLKSFFEKRTPMWRAPQ